MTDAPMRKRRWVGPLLLVIAAAMLMVSVFVFTRSIKDVRDGTIDTVAAASLQSLHEQARLTPFIARFVAVTTSTQERFGLSAKQTMILPGTVRYEIDLTAIKQRDVRWDEATGTLSVNLPPLALAGPEIDLKAMQVYDGGGLLMALTGAQKTLDQSNRARGQAELLAQAKGLVPMRLAREAARSAIERSFAMPLRAAGLEAKVVARFGGDEME